ncbi:FAD-dependent oxidoreductase [Kitasatospora sp. NPDC101183]|uniref:FAD-dependent oxidoreductase n=1 Tax=Kitasatospora sp. NPDC101183 TaxID=3364100 RepID=UPI003820423F
MRVLIIGAGLAGPCLAHGLLRHGHDVRLFERDAGLDSRAQGYRIHIGGDGAEALRRCLPAEAYEQAEATSCLTTHGVTLAGPGLREFHPLELPPGAAGLTVDRLTLRRIMLRGLTGAVRYGAAFTRYSLPGDGTVRVHLADGTTAEGDLLVATDGAHSGVRRQLLPDVPVSVLDGGLVYGRTPLTPEVRSLLPEPALGGFLGVSGGPGGHRLALAAHRFRRSPAEFGLPAAEDYVMWSVGAFPSALLSGSPAELLALASDALAGWHPCLGALIRLGDPRHVLPAAVHTSTRPGPRPPTPVTLLGDAAHPMPPAGLSAGAALHDAALLASHLTPGTPLPQALRAYEEEMQTHGFAAVAASHRTWAS